MFKKLFESRKTLTSLENTQGLRKEINRLKKLMLRQSDDLQIQTLNNIKWLETKLNGKI